MLWTGDDGSQCMICSNGCQARHRLATTIKGFELLHLCCEKSIQKVAGSDVLLTMHCEHHLQHHSHGLRSGHCPQHMQSCVCTRLRSNSLRFAASSRCKAKWMFGTICVVLALLVSCYESFGAGQASCESFFRTSAAQSHRGHTLDDVVLTSVQTGLERCRTCRQSHHCSGIAEAQKADHNTIVHGAKECSPSLHLQDYECMALRSL
mmetsp:Transcript_40263/g.92577  ORF Transcript_40263/g.92577 Transcript_40263/m.92577 type:complete len:207 (-) Transcript_40263:34-654(-)